MTNGNAGFGMVAGRYICRSLHLKINPMFDYERLVLSCAKTLVVTKAFGRFWHIRR